MLARPQRVGQAVVGLLLQQPPQLVFGEDAQRLRLADLVVLDGVDYEAR